MWLPSWMSPRGCAVALWALMVATLPSLPPLYHFSPCGFRLSFWPPLGRCCHAQVLDDVTEYTRATDGSGEVEQIARETVLLNGNNVCMLAPGSRGPAAKAARPFRPVPPAAAATAEGGGGGKAAAAAGLRLPPPTAAP